jgi:hypothetical protein
MSESPIRIYIGTDPSQLLGAKIFEFSVRRHTDAAVEFDTMLDVKFPFPKDPGNQPGTNFSFSRFTIPERAGYKGRGIYVDADMLVLRDIREIWNLPFNGATVLYAPTSNPKFYPRHQFSVMVLDCENLDWKLDKIITEGLDAGKFTYADLMRDVCIVPAEKVRGDVPPLWNALEIYVPEKTGLIHYTNMGKQPWLNARNKNGFLWMRYLKEALAAGFVTEDEVQAAQAKGWARPSLLKQLEWPEALWPLFKNTVARKMDKNFVPHKQLVDRKALVRAEGTSAASSVGPLPGSTKPQP